MRQWLAKNPLIVALITVVVLGVAGYVIKQSMQPVKPLNASLPNPVYYYDLADSQLFSGSGDDFPPIKAPKGEGVRAYVFACGACTEADRQLAYLETFSPDAQKYLRDNMNLPDSRPKQIMEHVDKMPDGHRIAVPGTTLKWVKASDPAAASIRSTFMSGCPGGKPAIECKP